MRIPLFPNPTLSSARALRGAVVREFRRCPEVNTVAPCVSDPAELVVTLSDGPVNCHLSNLSKAVLGARLSRRDQDTAIHGFVRGLIETQTLPAPSARDLIVGVRNRAYMTSMELAPLHRPFTGDLVVVLLQDLPKSVCMVTPDRLAEAPDLTETAAWAAAYDGLAEMLMSELDIFEEPHGGYWVGSETSPVLGNSALLAIPLLHHLRVTAGAETLLIAASGRDGIDVMDAATPGAEQRIEEAVLRGLDAAYGQSACVFGLSEGDALPRPLKIYQENRGFASFGGA